jgi:hypothetical protein
VTAQLIEYPNHEASAWLRGAVEDAGRRMIEGRVRGCGCTHVALPLVHVLWRPWCVTCLPCSRLLEDATDYTCDRCGRTAPKIVLGIVKTPAVIVGFGLCEDCQLKEVAA